MQVSFSQYIGRILALGIATITSEFSFAVGSHANNTFTIAEVVVTAQKREQSLKNVPISVNALSSATLIDAGINNIADVSLLVPSFEVQSNIHPFTSSYKIRRIGNEGNIPNFEPATGLFIDGAFRSRSGIGLSDLVDIERIEILKGPQSTLYGKNVTAGIVSVVTKLPSDKYEAEISVSGGSDSTRNIKGMVSGPLSKSASARISGSYRQRAGAMELVGLNGDHHDTNDISQYAIRGQLLYTDSDILHARIIFGATSGDMRANDSDIQFSASGLNIFGPFVTDNDSEDRKADLNYPAQFDMNAQEAVAIIEYNFNHLALTSISSWDTYHSIRTGDADHSTLDILKTNDVQEGETFSQEIRLSSYSPENTGWVLGTYYYTNQLQRGGQGKPAFITGSQAPLYRLAPVGVISTAGDIDALTESQNYAIFGQVNWQVNDNVSMTTGLRWSYEEKDVDIDKIIDESTPSVITTVLLPTTLGGKLNRNTDKFTGNLIVQYSPTEQLMTYASFTKGFKSGGFNAGFGRSPMDQREFDDEKVESFELGLKSTLFDDRMQLNTAAFYQTYSNYQVASFVSLGFLVNNADKTIVKGLEADGMVRLTENLSSTFGISYVDASYVSFLNGTCYPGRPIDNTTSGSCELSGEDLPFAPKLKATFGVQYQRPWASGDFYARTDISWTDDYLSNTNLDPKQTQSSYNLVNMRMGWKNRHYDMSIWINNATDETYVVQSATHSLLPTAGYQTFLNNPLTFGITTRFIY